MTKPIIVIKPGARRRRQSRRRLTQARSLVPMTCWSGFQTQRRAGVNTIAELFYMRTCFPSNRDLKAGG
jgi:hypothetical protein